jgi:hypothetical protein
MTTILNKEDRFMDMKATNRTIQSLKAKIMILKWRIHPTIKTAQTIVGAIFHSFIMHELLYLNCINLKSMYII